MTGELPSAECQSLGFSNVKFVFLDRDGVINRKAPDGKYVASWRDIEMLPGAERAVALLNQSSRKVIVVTNQRGIALGRLSELTLESIHRNLQRHLGSFGAHIDAIYFCPHDLGQCDCRKPAPGLFEFAFRDYPEAHPDNSVMIGDSNSDILAGASLGMKTILITENPNYSEQLTVMPSAAGRSLLEVVTTYLC